MDNIRGHIKLEVLKPFTDTIITLKNAPRLDSLENKTICEVGGTGGWGEAKTFPVIRELLKKRFPSVKFVSHTDLPNTPGSSAYKDQLDNVIKVVKEKKCDAVIVGNGG